MEDDLSPSDISKPSDEPGSPSEAWGLDLQPFEESDGLYCEDAMFNVLKATIQFPATPQAKAAKLADDMKFFYNCTENPDGGVDVMWMAVFYLAHCIPSDHEWQDSLLQSIHILQLRGGNVSDEDEVSNVHLTMPLEILTNKVLGKGKLELGRHLRIRYGDKKVNGWSA